MNSKQRAHLRSLAHRLDPIVHIGKEGVTDAAIQTLQEAFENRELLKVKVLEAAPGDARATADAITERLRDVHVAQVIGRVIVLYREHPEKPEIRLPE